jgi:hypothetical protein
MISNVGKLELGYLDRMTRQELIEAIELQGDCLRIDLQVRLEEISTDYLRWLLLATRLLAALRLLQGRTRVEKPSPAHGSGFADPSRN